MIDLIKESLQNSFQEFSFLLKKSNSENIEKNNKIIFDFYSNLKNYFSEYQINLADSLVKTFLSLFSTNLKSSSTQINFSDSCLNQNFYLIKPFGTEIISEMENQILLSLESAKFFSNGLTRARDIVLEIINRLEHPSGECKKLITTMTSCSLCTSDQFYYEKIMIKPCYQTCIQVYKTCFLMDLAKFDDVWNTFLGELN